MSVHEIDIGYSWIYATLTGDTTLMGSIADKDCHRHFADPETPQPYLIMEYRPATGGNGTDAMVFGNKRAYADLLFEVRVIGDAALYTQIASAASRVDDLLKGVNLMVTGGTIMAAFRHEAIEEDVLENGVNLTNIGGAYRLMIAQS